MIHVKPQEPNKKWLDRAKKATERIIKKFKDEGKLSSESFTERVWQDLRPHLKVVFNKKCAYCEGNYGAGTQMEVEHYRPKGAVTHDRNPRNKCKIIDKKGKEQDHPGYYWLAYDCENLLYSCPNCNGNEGKMNQFPLFNPEKRACTCKCNLDEEKPILLNPYKDEDIENHITFGEFGEIVNLSFRGEMTIKICNLDREDLKTKRQQAWEFFEMKQLLNEFEMQDIEPITDKNEYSAYLRTCQIRQKT